jgi:hypothetical protein
MRYSHPLWRSSETPANRNKGTSIWRIEFNTPRSFRAGGGVVVCCLSGELWITQEGSAQDHIVPRGHCFSSDREGLIVLDALRGPSMALVYRNDAAVLREFAACGVHPDHRGVERVVCIARALRRRAMKRLACEVIRAICKKFKSLTR